MSQRSIITIYHIIYVEGTKATMSNARSKFIEWTMSEAVLTSSCANQMNECCSHLVMPGLEIMGIKSPVYHSIWHDDVLRNKFPFDRSRERKKKKKHKNWGRSVIGILHELVIPLSAELFSFNWWTLWSQWMATEQQLGIPSESVGLC